MPFLPESAVVQEQQADLFGMRGVLYIIMVSIALGVFCVFCEWLAAAYRDVQRSKANNKVSSICIFYFYLLQIFPTDVRFKHDR